MNMLCIIKARGLEIANIQFYEHFKKFREICFCSYFREIWLFHESNYIFEISRPLLQNDI